MSITEQACPVSHWPDTDEIIAKSKKLIAEEPYGVNKPKMAEYDKYFEEKCAKSKASTAEAMEYIPGGVQHNLAFNHPFPLDIVKAEGAYLWDLDGNQYIDFLQAGGPTVLGSNYAPVREKVIEVLHNAGPVTGLFHEYELKLAKFIHDHIPSIDKFRMLGSGTEACMAAIRAARNYTSKRHIIKVGAGYHGWSDQLVWGTRIPGTASLEAHGIPDKCLEDTHEFYPNNIDGEGGLRELLEKNKANGGTAAVIVEPFGPESGSRPYYQDFNQKVRELCDEYDTLLIFDEVVTAFRLGLSGAQGYFGVTPDLTVFGKCVAGGYPAAGGVGGRCEVMDTFAGGIGAGSNRTLVGGTLSANPISCAAGYYSLVEMERTDAPLKAGRAGDRITEGLNKVINELELPFFAYNYGSIVHLMTHGVILVDVDNPDFMRQVFLRKKIAEEMGAAYTAEGVITLAGSRIYTSMADTDDIIDDAVKRIGRVLEKCETYVLDL